VINSVDKYSKFVSGIFQNKPQTLYIKTFHQNSYTGRMQSFLSDYNDEDMESQRFIAYKC